MNKYGHYNRLEKERVRNFFKNTLVILPIQQTPKPSAHVPSEEPPMLSHSPL